MAEKVNSGGQEALAEGKGEIDRQVRMLAVTTRLKAPADTIRYLRLQPAAGG